MIYINYLLLLFLRDLIKLCNRLNCDIKNKVDQNDVYKVIEDIKDCFFAYITNRETRESLMIEMGTRFNVNKENVNKIISILNSNTISNNISLS